ncbi:malto-oligosyltrehalose synthase [Rhizobium sp.]
MTFDRAVERVSYWKSLGISHLYASPIFAAVSGSTHGYDVTDPNKIDPDLGGMDGFRRLSDALMAAGLGLILDIVPNHMAASLENPYWRDVLKLGRHSRFAGWFDNDWEQKLTLPVLAEPLETIIVSGNGKLRRLDGSDEIVFDYYYSAYPLEPSTYDHAIDGGMLVSDPARILNLLDRQPWRMIHWRDAAKGLSYRRFFEITGLVGARVEDPTVFDATHALILDLVAQGRVQGLRIDHIDGLADPTAYLQRLRKAVGPQTYFVVEKILEGDEQCPADWPIEGTTGYEFIFDMAGLLTAESPALDAAWETLAPDFDQLALELSRAKRLMVDVNFNGEVAALIRRAASLAESAGRADLAPDMMAEAVRLLVAGFDVYRTYGNADGLSEQDRRLLGAMFERLSGSAPQLRSALAFIVDVLFGRIAPEWLDDAIAFRTRLQHLTGPILAKSLEDTFFYRYNRLIALNEVGGDPMADAGSIAHFHWRMRQRLAAQPHALTATATHDTKRGEDARARLYAISEAPDDWIALTARWRETLVPFVTQMAGGPAPEPAIEWLIFQSLAGMLPPDFDPADLELRSDIQDRFLAYIEKALREAKLRTNWTDVNEAYEKAVKDYATAAIGSATFIGGFWTDIQPFVRTGVINSVTQTLLKLTVPGVPDIYQGTEAADMSLVDPDNRRMPDDGHLMSGHEDTSFESAKTCLIRTALRLRNHHPELFACGDYIPLDVAGRRRDNIVAFARRHHGRLAITVAPRLVHQASATDALQSPAYWDDTAVILPKGARLKSDDGAYGMTAEGRIRISELFRREPYALLIAEG